MTDPIETRKSGGQRSLQSAERSGKPRSFSIKKTLSKANQLLGADAPTQSEKNPFAAKEDISFSLPKMFRDLKKMSMKDAQSHFNKLKKDKDATILDKASHLGKAAISTAAAAPFEIATRAFNMLEKTVSAPSHIQAVKGLKALVKKPEKFQKKELFHKLLKNIQHTDFSRQKDGAGVRKSLGMQNSPIEITSDQYAHSKKVIGISLTEAIFQTKQG